jgi:hypothetical protein
MNVSVNCPTFACFFLFTLNRILPIFDIANLKEDSCLFDGLWTAFRICCPFDLTPIGKGGIPCLNDSYLLCFLLYWSLDSPQMFLPAPN